MRVVDTTVFVQVLAVEMFRKRFLFHSAPLFAYLWTNTGKHVPTVPTANRKDYLRQKDKMF